jgi:hypothetical protein
LFFLIVVIICIVVVFVFVARVSLLLLVWFGRVAGVGTRSELDETRVLETLANGGEESIERGNDGLFQVSWVDLFCCKCILQLFNRAEVHL